MLGEDSDFNTPLIGIRDPQTSVNFDFISKILIVGDSGVGKSQLFRRFANEEFSEVYETTQSVEYRHRLIETEQYRSKVQLWDCVSSVSKAVTQSIYRGANAIILLYDVTNPSTIDSASDWINEILHYVNQEVLIYLVGSKIDLKERKISLEQGKQLAAKLKLEYWELSSKTGEHVDELFYRIVTDLQEMTVKAMENKEYNIAANEKVRREYLITVDKKEGCCSCCVIS